MFPFFQLGVSVWQVPVKRPVVCEWVKQIIYCAEQNNAVSPSFKSVVPLAAAAVCVFWPGFPVMVVTQCSVAGWAANCLFQMGQFHFIFLFIFLIQICSKSHAEKQLCMFPFWFCFINWKKSFPAPASSILPFPLMMSTKLWQEANIWHAETPLHSEQDAGTKH